MRKLPVLLAPAVLLAAAVVAAPAAHAVSADVTCAGTAVVHYSPGLLLTTQTVQVSATAVLAPCVSSDGAITAGNYQTTLTADLSCLNLLSGRSGVTVFHWSNGRSSTFAFNRNLTNAGGQTTITFTGDITAGEFAGDTAVEQIVFATPNILDCLAAPGLTNLGPGPIVLTIAQP